MKKDALEKMVRENREAFDAQAPSSAVLDRTINRLFGRSLWNSVHLWRVAAVLFLGISIVLFVRKADKVSPITKGPGIQEFIDIEKFYSAQISEKSALISTEGLFEDDNFTQDLQKLEAMYAVLLDEMKRRPSEKVKDALVLNMLVRIDLLNQQIQKLEETKRKKEVISSI